MQASKLAEANAGNAADHAWWATALLVIAHALAFFLAFPRFDLWFLMPFAIALLVLAAAGARRALALYPAVAVVHFVMWLLALDWVMHVTTAGYPFMCFGMTLFSLLFIMLMRATSRARALMHWPFAVTVPILWTGVECLRGEIAFHGYPWYFAAHPFASFPAFIQSADLFGTYFISFLVAMLAGAIVDIVRAWRVGIRLAGRLALFAVGANLAINIGYGASRLSQTDSLTPGPRIVAVQTNLPQENKIGWGPTQWERDVPGFLDLTRRAVADAHNNLGGVDLVIWPETMLPGAGFDEDMLENIARVGPNGEPLLRWQRNLLTLRDELGIDLLVGSQAWLEPKWIEEDGLRKLRAGTQFNAAYLLADDPPFIRYDKFFLTPFGETMPYISAWPWLEEKLLGIGAAGMTFDLAAGPTLDPLEFTFSPAPGAATQSLHIGTPICFEDSVAWVCRRMIYHDGEKRGDMFINISNDGWFGESDAARAHHLQIARFRCVENRVPMVRAVNTGYSAAIDSAGRIVSVVGDEPIGTPRREGWLLTQPALDRRHSLYGRIGDVWAYACLLASAGMLVATFFLRERGST